MKKNEIKWKNKKSTKAPWIESDYFEIPSPDKILYTGEYQSKFGPSEYHVIDINGEFTVTLQSNDLKKQNNTAYLRIKKYMEDNKTLREYKIGRDKGKEVAEVDSEQLINLFKESGWEEFKPDTQFKTYRNFDFIK